jgi:hypothetical protein
VQVIWDLCHYGWPEEIDIWKPEFIREIAAYCRAFALLLRAETDEIPFYTPINEISFWAWAGAEAAEMNPFACWRAPELKRQLIRASLAAIEAIRSVDPRARILHSEPLIHVAAETGSPEERAAAEGFHRAQFQALDAIAGRLWPELGGDYGCLDLVGVNFYPGNQWLWGGPKLLRGEPSYRPLRQLLVEVHERYRRPLVLSETGAEGDERPGWLAYVADEVRSAIHQKVPVEGICLYPVVDYPAWDDERRCPTGLWGYADETGRREIYEPLARELARQQALCASSGSFRNARIYPAAPPDILPISPTPTEVFLASI